MVVIRSSLRFLIRKFTELATNLRKILQPGTICDDFNLTTL
jgi:hypothetical protein